MVGQRHCVVEADLDGWLRVFAVGGGGGASAVRVGACGRGPCGAGVELAQDVSSVIVGRVEATTQRSTYVVNLKK